MLSCGISVIWITKIRFLQNNFSILLRLLVSLFFPNFKTVWHFDDKLGQKYLFESIKAPLVTSYAFLYKAGALLWANKASFPKVFKLRGGAGSTCKASRHKEGG